MHTNLFFNFIYSGLCHKVSYNSYIFQSKSNLKLCCVYAVFICSCISFINSFFLFVRGFFYSVNEKASSSSLSLFGVAVCLIYIMLLMNFFCQTPEWIECVTTAYKYCVDRNYAPCIVGKNKLKYRLITAAVQRDWLYWFLQWVLTQEV